MHIRNRWKKKNPFYILQSVFKEHIMKSITLSYKHGSLIKAMAPMIGGVASIAVPAILGKCAACALSLWIWGFDNHPVGILIENSDILQQINEAIVLQNKLGVTTQVSISPLELIAKNVTGGSPSAPMMELLENLKDLDSVNPLLHQIREHYQHMSTEEAIKEAAEMAARERERLFWEELENYWDDFQSQVLRWDSPLFYEFLLILTAIYVAYLAVAELLVNLYNRFDLGGVFSRLLKRAFKYMLKVIKYTFFE